MSGSRDKSESPAQAQMQQALSALVRPANSADSELDNQPVSLNSFGLRSQLRGDGNHGFMDLAMPTPHLTVIRGMFTLAEVQVTAAAAEQDCIRIRLGLSGEVQLSDQNGHPVESQTPGCLLAAQPAGCEFQYQNHALCQYRQVNFVLLRGTLTDQWGFDSSNLPQPLSQFEAGELHSLAFRALPMTPSLIAIGTDILECDFSGVLLDQFLQAKAREALCLIIHALQAVENQSAESKVPVEHTPKLGKRDLAGLAKVRGVIEQNFSDPPSLQELASQVGINRNKLCAAFQAEYGLPIHEFARELRLQKALSLLREGGISITEVAMEVGYGHSSSLTTAVKRRFGVSPKQLRKS